MGLRAHGHHDGPRVRRHGIASMLAMLYLVLFAVLAVGFSATTATNVQVSENERQVSQAVLAAETGLDFMTYQLSRVTVPPVTTAETLLAELETDLKTQLLPTPNFQNKSIREEDDVLYVPTPGSGYVGNARSGSFRAEIVTTGMRAVVKAVGRPSAGTNNRAVALQYRLRQHRSPILDYGVATRGTVKLTGGSYIRGSPDGTRGSFLSTNLGTSTPVTISKASISGTVSLSHPSGSISGTTGSIGGQSDPANWPVYKNVAPPEFPTVDTTAFRDYLVGRETLITGNTGLLYLENIRIKAGTNPTFSNGPLIRGVILIEAPNQVTFSGGATIEGVIAVANPSESTATNQIVFSGGGTVMGPENLPDSFGALKTMTGSAILAPNFAVNISGGGSTIGGTVVAKSLVLSGGSGGTVNGSVILTGTGLLDLSGGSGITIGNAPSEQIPAGLTFSSSFVPIAETFEDVTP